MLSESRLTYRTVGTSTCPIKVLQGVSIPDRTVAIMVPSRVEPPTHRTESATGECIRKLLSRLRSNQEHRGGMTRRLMRLASCVDRARDRWIQLYHGLRALLEHGTYGQDRTRTRQPASLILHTIPAASESNFSRSRDLSRHMRRQPLRPRALQAYRMHWSQSRKVTSILLLPKTIGLPWPLRSGKHLSYVTVKQYTELSC
jgi:hypothetical protein